MKVVEIMEAQKIKIFCDLDGVLADFHKKALEVAGIDPDEANTNTKLANDFWKRIGGYCKRGNKFFEAMDMMPDARELWNYIKRRKPTILSATGNVGNPKEEKRNWVRKHLGLRTSNEALFVRTAAEKQKYAAPNHLLIDDKRKALDPWIAAGGIGILHTSARATIKELKALGL